jgi:Secretion system C-terminal sorting domain
MKRLFTFLLFSLLITFNVKIYAQASAYAFSQSVNVYTAFSDGTVALSGDLNTNTAFNLPIGFNFSFSGISFNQFAVSTDGYLKLQNLPISGYTSTSTPLSSGSSTDTYIISAAGSDLLGGVVFRGAGSGGSAAVTVDPATISSTALTSIQSGQSVKESSSFPSSSCRMGFQANTAISSITGLNVIFDKVLNQFGTNYVSSGCTSPSSAPPTQVNNGVVRYKVVGSAPNRQLLVQWSSFRVTGSLQGDWMNFQIILEETTNKINIVYGYFDCQGLNTSSNKLAVGIKTTSTDFKALASSSSVPLPLTASWSSPIVLPNATITTLGSSNTQNMTLLSTNIPVQGLTYTFTPPLCFPPNTVNITEITQTGGKINWLAPLGGSLPDNYDAELVTSPTAFTNTPSAGLSAVSSGVAIPTVLTNSTAYKVQVRSNCGVNGLSTWSPLANFSTLCPAVALSTSSIAEGFNSTLTPACWSYSSISYNPGSAQLYFSTTTQSGPNASAYEGTGMTRYLASSAKPGQQERLISPPVNTMGLTQAEISFAMFEDNSTSFGTDDKVIVQYSSDFGLTWNTIAENKRAYTVLVTNRWSKRYFQIPAGGLGQTNLLIGLVFSVDAAGSSSKMYIDDFKVNSGGTIKEANAATCVTTSAALGSATNSSSLSNIPLAGLNWFRFTDGGGIIAEINPNGNDLGLVSIKYQESASGVVPVYGSGAYTSKILPRYFTVKPANAGPFNTNGGPIVRLYYSDAELADFNTSKGSSFTISSMNIYKSNPAVEDCDPTNNAVNPTTPTMLNRVDYGSGFYLEYQTPTFSEFSAADIVVLAVELKNLSANSQGNANVINWTTATEKNNAYFAIERSANGETGWVNIGTVKGLSNTSVETNYSFNDNTPLSISYYRLRSVDNQGKEELSKVVSVYRKTGKFNINKIFPNPSVETFNIDFEATSISKVIATVTDIVGRVVSIQTIQANEGLNRFSLNLNGLPQGSYILSLKEGNTVATQRIVKQ